MPCPTRSMDRSIDVTAVPPACSALKFVDGRYGSLKLFDTGLEGFVGLLDVHVFRSRMREYASMENFAPSNNKGTRPPLISHVGSWEVRLLLSKGPDPIEVIAL